ncbi:MAG: ABC transporter permease [Microbacteriaceae bacterium]|nr:ABC transporter permease [Microbacteriaceae bacterium]
MSLITERRHDGASPAPAGGASPRPAARRRRGPHRWRTWERVSLGLGGILVFCAIVQFVTTVLYTDHDTLPVFGEVLVRFVRLFGEPAFYAALWETIAAFLLGIVIATVIGVALGVLFGLSELTYRSSRTTVELLRPIPATALIPVMIIIFGTGLGMKTILVVFASVWAILFNALYGVRNVDPLTKDMARTFGLKRFAVIRRVVLPAALPMIWAGVRISATVSLIVVITLELLLGGSVGVGGMIAQARAGQNDVLAAYSAIIVAGVLGLLVNIALAAVERRFFAWSTTTREG